MKSILSLLMLAALALSALAGPVVTKNVVAPPQPTADYFGPGAYIGLFGSSLVDSKPTGWGGGASASYFFNRNFGLELSYGAHSESPDVRQQILGSLVLRAPIGSVAPYLILGGGYEFSVPDQWTVHAGGGLEVKLAERFGIFTDATYHFHGADSNNLDATQVRLGFKIAL